MVRYTLGQILVVPSLVILFAAPANSGSLSFEPLNGKLMVTSDFGSGWLELKSMTDFKKGVVVRVVLGDTARKVVVRLLPHDGDPDSTDGVVTGCIEVPEGGVLDVKLRRDHVEVRQISVHGGPKPFGKLPCGGGNGPATLLGVEVGKP